MFCLQEKDASNHPAMWEMLLAFISSQQPDCWSHINMQKAFAPRLLALLRHGCYGSAASSLPALLPLVALMPHQLQGFQPLLLLDSVLEAVWAGLQQCAGSGAARAASAAAYQEVLAWGLRNAAGLSQPATAAAEVTQPAAAAVADDGGSDAAAVKAACEQLLLQGHFNSLLDLAVGGSGADAQLAAGVVQELLLEQCSSSSAADNATAAAASIDSRSEQPVQLQVLLAAIGAAAAKHLTAAANAYHSAAAAEEDGSDAAAAASSAAAVCSRLQQLFDALADAGSSVTHSQAAASSLASCCCAAVLPLLQDGQQLPATASQLVARLVREYPSAANATTAAAGGTAAAAAATAVASDDSSIAALVRLGLTNCQSNGQLSAADLDLLLSCIAGAADSAAAWAAVFGLITADADASGSAVSGWRFVDALLRGFASSSNPAGLVTSGWSHPQLDALVLQLTGQLRAAEVAAAVEWSSHKQQAAAASLLGCCLGANEQQQVLLSPPALETALADLVVVLAAAHQLLQDGGAHEEQPAIAEAAAVCVSALRMALASSGRGSDRSSSSSSSGIIWGQQPGQLVQLLVLLAQLSWGGGDELQLPDSQYEEEEEGSVDVSGPGRDSSSSAGSSSDSDSSDLDDLEDYAADTVEAADAVAGGKLAGSSSDKGAWHVLQQAAARVWNAYQLISALDDLPAEQGQQLVTQLQQLLHEGLSTAAAAAAASSAASEIAAAVESGVRWGNRAAVVLSGLEGRQWQQQELVQQLLAAASGWQCWSSSGSKEQVSTSSSSVVDGVDSAVQALMVTVSSVLVLQVGCGVMLPLQGSVGHNKDNSSTNSSTQWLLLELLCTSRSLTASIEAAGAAQQQQQQLLHCVPAAAAAAEQYILRNAARSGNKSAAAAGRTLLAGTLSTLLSSAQVTAAAGSSSHGSASPACKVYCSTLTSLLQLAVELVAARTSAAQQLLPVLQTFCSSKLVAAASSYMQSSEGSSSAAAAAAAAATPAWVLVQLLEVLAGAFRFADEACVTAAGLSQLSVGFVNKALVLDPTAPQDGSSSSSGQLQLEVLQLAVACFPLQYNHGNASHHHHHHTQQQQQLAAGSSTALERQALAALLRHACSTTGSTSAAGSAAGSTVASTVELLCQLQLCCVGYCWQDMSAAEWHVVLRDCQARLSSTRRKFERAAGSLAGAACAAAQQLTAALSSDNVMTPATAVEMLRKLSSRGLLQRQAAVYGQLVAAAQKAVDGLSLPLLRLGLQLLAAVLQLQQQIQAAGRAPQLDLALSSAWRELLLTVMALGGSLAISSSCGPAASSVLMQCLEGQAAAWQLLSKCCSVGPEQSETVGQVLAAADERAEMLGVDAVSCCLVLLQAPLLHHSAATHTQQQQQVVDRHAVEPLQQMAWQLLLHPASIFSITHAAAAAASGTADELPEFGVNDDAAAFLVQVGLRPEMSAGLIHVKPWQGHLLYWALLLAHIAQLTAPGSKTKSSVAAQRSLTQALRDVPELVPQLLDRVVGLMGLGGRSKAAAAAAVVESAAAEDGSSSTALAVMEPNSAAGSAAAAVIGGGGGAGLSVAAQVQLSAKLQQLGTGSAAAALAGDVWELSAALRTLGQPLTHSSWRLLAAALYRAVLQQLPASARLWFSDLRDRARLAAVESYTMRFESPALLAAEFAAIRRDAGGASGEVGGSCSFRVRASPAAREVTAVLEIEDGATLELQVKLPAAAPLKAAEVECRNKVSQATGCVGVPPCLDVICAVFDGNEVLSSSLGAVWGTVLSMGCSWDAWLSLVLERSYVGASGELPAAPLKAAEVECRNKVSGATECVWGTYV
jgi:hypothetical protein